MDLPREVVFFLLALFLLLGTMHGTRAQYEDYDGYDEDYENDYDYDYDEDEDESEDGSDDSEDSEEDDEEGESPQWEVEPQGVVPDCNKENCWIRVDWRDMPRDSRKSCLYGYRVGIRKDPDREGFPWPWDWTYDGGTHRDLRLDRLFFFDSRGGTNHSVTIRNL